MCCVPVYLICTKIMNACKKILVVEDQKDINDLISLNLESLNFHVTQCQDGSQGLELASTSNFDAILLDIMLPGMDGLQICQSLRAKSIHTPILMLTAKKSEADRVVGLEVGADDYLTKPFSVLELQARVKALLRRVEFHSARQDTHSNHVTVSAKNLEIDESRHQVKANGKKINLTAKEFDLLIYLAKHPGEVFSRDQLLDAVWGYQHSGYEHTVNSHINRLRSKIEQEPAQPHFIHTVWGVGYKFDDQDLSL